MNITYLRYAIEVSKTKSITKAAQNLYMGQPNLSKAIKNLETEVGFTIFIRTPSGVKVTPKGAEFLSRAYKLLSQIDDLAFLYQSEDDSSKDMKFRIASYGAFYISSAFTDFIDGLKKNDKLSISYKEESSMEVIEDVHNGKFTIGVISYPNVYESYFLSYLKEKNIRYEPLCEYSLCLLLSRNHPLASLDEMPYHLLSYHTEILSDDFEIPYFDEADSFIKEQINAVSKVIYTRDKSMQLDILKKIEGTFMWTPPIPDKVIIKNDLILKRLPIPEGINKDIIIYPKDYVCSSVEKKFVEMLKIVANAIK